MFPTQKSQAAGHHLPRSAAAVALIYRGPASTPGCPEAAQALLRAADPTLRIRFVGPHEPTPLSPHTLAQACLYVQPGGPSLRRSYRLLHRHRPAITHYVHSGGRYLGLCLGAYLAGHTPGFDLLPGDAHRYIATPGSTVTGPGDTSIDVTWAGTRRPVFFQDGPTFTLHTQAHVQVLATYPNGHPAALVTSCGGGVVGVAGPHPEATADWFLDAGLPRPSQLAIDLGVDLIRRVMSR